MELSKIEFDTFDNMLTFANGRKRLIELATIKHDDNWQDVGTPYDIAGEMTDLVKHDGTCYLVLFALEFLEVMVHERGILPESILFVTDYETEGDMAKAMYGIDSVICTKNMIMVDGKFDFGVTKSIISDKMVENQLGEYGMKFNKVAVIGNPPYQVNDGGGNGSSAKPIYHLFVEAAIDHLNPDYLSMIIPSRWMVGGKGLDSHRERMMNDTRMKKIVHFGGDNEIFNTVSISGGVNYFLWEKEHNGECEFVNGNSITVRFLNEYDIIVQDNNSFGILEKVLYRATNMVSQTVSVRRPFGLPTNFQEWGMSGVKCYASDKLEHYVAHDKFTDKNAILAKWKVCCGVADGASQKEDNNGRKRVLKNIFTIEPNAICTESYLVLAAFNSQTEATNYITYAKSNLFRFMLSLRVTSQLFNRSIFAWVPDLQDYSAPWTDAELYKKFGLTRQEIAYIESKIKAI